MTAPLATPPATALAQGQWQYGRYDAPIREPDLHVRGLQRFRLKEWHYTSLTTDEWFVAFGVVGLGYLANAFGYVVDRRGKKAEFYEFETLSPLGQALHIAPSSVHGATEWRHGKDRIVASYRAGWRVELDVAIGGKRLTGTFSFDEGPSLALLFELGRDKPAYTHKLAGVPARGALAFGGESIDLSRAVATLDWTRSLAKRHTIWKWASIGGYVGDSRFGLNLSSDVYDHAGHSQENACWRQGRVTALGGVRFVVPSGAHGEPWSIKSIDSDEVDLQFEPHGARSMDLDYKVIRTRFTQPFGIYRGRVLDQKIDGLFGVAEDHEALW